MTKRFLVRSICFLSCWGLWLAAPFSLAAEDLDGVRVRLVNGSSIRASISAIDQIGAISGSKNLADSKLDDLTGIMTGLEIEKNPANVLRVELRHGGNLACETVNLQDGLVRTSSAMLQERFPLEIAEAFVWQDSTKVDELLAKPSTQFDSVVVATRKGEVVVNGLVEAIDSTQVTIDYNGKTRPISLKKVRAVVMAALGNQSDQDGKQSKGGQVRVSLANGSLICGTLANYSDGKMSIKMSEQFAFNIDAEQISKIDIQSGSVVYLSDMEPINVDQQSQFALPRPWQRDKSLLGNPIQLKYSSSGRIVDFEKGIGTRSFTSLVFENVDGFSRLRTVVGIDAETGGNGDCEMVVEGDGIRLWSKRVSGNSDPEPVVVEIEGISEVALIVYPGANFDLGDHAVWADAKFTKSN